MSHTLRAWTRTVSVVLAFWALGDAAVRAGDGPLSRREARALVIFRARPRYTPATTSYSRPLGTFTPTPYITVGGSNPIGPGYSPLDIYGDQTLSLYGPLSPFR